MLLPLLLPLLLLATPSTALDFTTSTLRVSIDDDSQTVSFLGPLGRSPAPAPPTPAPPTWGTKKDLAIACTAAEFVGDLGAMSSDACLAAAKADGGVDYAVWRGDNNRHCYVCDLAGRGDPSAWDYGSVPGAVSFAADHVNPPQPTRFNFAAARPAGAGYHRLGDVTVRARTAGAAAWASATTAVPAAKVEPLAPSGAQRAAANLTAALGAVAGLVVTRAYGVDGATGDLLLTFEVSNGNADDAVELGGFGVSMIFDQVFTGRSLEQVGSECSFSDPYIGGGAGYLQVAPTSGRGAALLVLPEDPARGRDGDGDSGARNNSFEAYRRLHDDKTGTSVTFEGFYELTTYSAAYAEGEWAFAAPFNAPRFATLLPGAAPLRLVYRFALVPEGLRGGGGGVAAALAARGRPSTFAAPGYIVTPDMAQAAVFVRPAPGRTVSRWALDRPGRFNVSAAPLPGAAAWRFGLRATGPSGAAGATGGAAFRVANAGTQALLTAAAAAALSATAVSARSASDDAVQRFWSWGASSSSSAGTGAALCLAPQPGGAAGAGGASPPRCLSIVGGTAAKGAKLAASAEASSFARFQHRDGRLVLAGNSSLTMSTAGGTGVGNVLLQPTCATAGCAADQVWELAPAAFGRATLSIEYDDGLTQAVHLLAMPPLAVSAAAYAAHVAGPMWFDDEGDVFQRAPSFLNWNSREHGTIQQEQRAWIAGLSDECGASPAVGAAAVAASRVLPAPQQATLLTALDAYTRQTLAPSANGSRTTVQGADGGIRASMFYSGRSDFAYDVAPGWDAARAATTWRSFNYPHPTATYLAQYNLARNAPAGAEQLGESWQWYLRRAVNTTLSAAAFGGYNKFGLMLGSVWTQLVASLQTEADEGGGGEWAVARDAIRTWAYGRAVGWNASAFPFGSEMPWDSTGQEEIHAWLAFFASSGSGGSSAQPVTGFAAQANFTADAVRAYMPELASWAYQGNGRRYFDFLVYGDPVLNTGAEREFHHYGAPLNALPLLSAVLGGEAAPGASGQSDGEISNLAVALGGVLGSFTNIRPGSGEPSMAWHGDAGALRRDGYSCDFGVGFYGAMGAVGAYVARHSEFGTLCFLCNLDEQGAPGVLAVRPLELAQRRLFFGPAHALVVSENEPIALATFDEAHRSVALTLGPGTAVARLALSISNARTTAGRAAFRVVAVDGTPYHAAPVRGAFEVPLSAGKPTVVQCTWD